MGNVVDYKLKAASSGSVLSYPTDVTYVDGHYIMFKIFEQAGVEWSSPYTDVNLPGMQISNLKTSLQGALGTAVNRIKEKVFSKLGTKIQNFSKLASAEFGGGRKTGKFTVHAGKGRADKRHHKGDICLYTPPQVNVNWKAIYETEALTGLGTPSSTIAEWMTGNQAAGSAIADQVKKFIAGTQHFVGVGGLTQRMLGEAINRNFADVIFTGVDFRTFTFEYSFMPASEKEAKEVDKIINMFQYYAMPLRRQDVAMTYELPATFELVYMYYGNKNKYIMPALALGLEGIDIKYGGEKFATFRGDERGAQPVRTDMTLTFREIEVADRASIYGDTVAQKYEGVDAIGDGDKTDLKKENDVDFQAS
jgi:hypothetical protein